MNLLDRIAYDTGGYTVQEILSSFCKKILEIIDLVNKNEEVCDETHTIIENIRNEVVPDLVDDIIKEMQDNGYFDRLVNVTLIEQLRTELTTLLNDTITEHTTRLDNFDSQMENIKKEKVLLINEDVFLDDEKTIISGEKLSALIENSNKTYYLCEGEFLLDSPIYAKGGFSLEFSDNCFIKAIKPMEYMLKVYSVGTGGYDNKNKSFRGGTFDGNYLANTCIEVEYTHNSKFSNIYIKNPLNYGFYVGGGYGSTFEKISCINDKDSLAPNESATGFYLKTADTMVYDLIVCNFNIGLEVTRGANVINKVHVWANKESIIRKSYGIIERSGFNSYTDTYCDTCNVGIYIAPTTPFSSKFKNPKFTYGNDYRPSGVNPIFIICQSEEIQYIDGGFFSFHKTSETTNTIQVWSGKNLEFSDSSYIEKDNLTSLPTDVQKINLKKQLITVQGATIKAGQFETINVPLNGIKYNDTAIINSTGYYDRRLTVSYVLLDDKVMVTVYNPTSTDITFTDTKVYVTFIRDYFGNII